MFANSFDLHFSTKETTFNKYNLTGKSTILTTYRNQAEEYLSRQILKMIILLTKFSERKLPLNQS